MWFPGIFVHNWTLNFVENFKQQRKITATRCHSLNDLIEMRHNRDSTRYRHDTLQNCTVYRFHFHHDPAFRNVMSTLNTGMKMITMTTMSDERRQRRRETTMNDEWKPKIIISIVQLLGSSKFKSFFTKLNWVSSTLEFACWISAFYVLERRVESREIFCLFFLWIKMNGNLNFSNSNSNTDSSFLCSSLLDFSTDDGWHSLAPNAEPRKRSDGLKIQN